MLQIWQIAVVAVLGASQLPAPGPMPPPGTFPPVDTQPAPSPSSPQTATPPPGRQESLVTVEWVGPSLAQVGQQAEYSLMVRNTSPVAVQKVMVYVRLAAGMTVKGTQPSAAIDGTALAWQLDTLLPRQEKRLRMQLVVNARGDVTPQAWATFTGVSSSALRIRVSEPKLTLKVTAPGHVVAGDPANFTLTVSNAGDCLAGQVKVHADLSEGLEHVRGRAVDFEVGDLAIGESRAVQLACIARAGGEQKCDVTAASAGCVKTRDRGLVQVIVPSLDVELSGPGVRYVDRKATYTVRVTNRGQVPASNVTVTESIPPGFTFVAAAGGRHSPTAQTVSWFLGELAPGQARQLQVELKAVKAGEHHHRATACSEHGFKVEASRELVTRVEDFSALGLEIAHADDAIEVGKDTTYEVLVSNAGSRMETNVKLICALSEKMAFGSVQGPTRYHREGSVIVFEPVLRLAPRGDLVYRIKVKALEPGDVRFKVQVTSSNLVEPVIKTEATRIYSDRP